MSEQRIYCMDLVKKEDPEKAVRTPFYQTESTGGSVWVIKPGQTLQKHYHHNSDDIWIVLQGSIQERPCHSIEERLLPRSKKYWR